MGNSVARSSPAIACCSAALVLWLAGCASAPNPAPEPAETHTAPDPAELNIPIPEHRTDCDCDVAVAAAPENYFDRGVRALAARDYARALVYFQRHRDSAEDQAVREAEVGMAFVALLDSDNGVSIATSGASGIDERAEVMTLALAAIRALEGQLATLQHLNDVLSSDLAKREEALKRLRDLTLGQPEGAR